MLLVILKFQHQVALFNQNEVSGSIPAGVVYMRDVAFEDFFGHLFLMNKCINIFVDTSHFMFKKILTKKELYRR
jgi:hypothetical protein